MAAKKSKSIRKSAPARPAKARTANPTHRRTVVPAPITPDEARAQLRELAMNLWWSWNEVAQRPFAAIDPVLWHATKRSPLAVLAQASPAALSAACEGSQQVCEQQATYPCQACCNSPNKKAI